jgi:hypothetical protein
LKGERKKSLSMKRNWEIEPIIALSKYDIIMDTEPGLHHLLEKVRNIDDKKSYIIMSS